MKKFLKLIIFGLLGAFLFFAALTYFPTKTSVQALPGSFEKTKLAEGFNMPTDFAFSPDGRVYILEKGGNIKLLKNGQTLNYATLPVNSDGERGLLGIALDPSFASNKFVYLYYTRNNPLEIRVSRFIEAGDTLNLASETVLLKSVQPLNLNHHAGTLRFGPDGKLWITVGNNLIPSNPQDLSNIHGKILRINKDGTIPSDNPFVSSGTAKKEIYAYGLRNPFRFNFLQDGRAIVGDVGESQWEEVNVITKGGNFGFPQAEGVCNNCPYINPIYSYNHNNTSASVTGGLIYTGNTFPQEYKGNYFFGDYAMGFIKRLVFDSSGNLIEEKSFDDSAGTVVELLQGGDGNLYFLTIFPGELYKINFTSDNIAPTAKISANKTSGSLPLSVNFSSHGSSDPEGKPLNYKWDFGDGKTLTEANPTHVYSQAGKYTASLIVNDGSKDSERVTLEIHAGNNAPQINFITPAAHSKYNAGINISYNASATDPEDGTLAASAFSWEIIFHHGTHIHPFLGPINGVKSGNFTVPNTGEPAPDTWYELKLTVTDSVGLKTTVSRNILPNKIKITLTSSPPGLSITVDGVPITTPTTFEGVVGFRRTLDVTTPQVKDGIGYDFTSWSDGGAKSHQITTPSTDTAYTASFKSAGSGKGNLRFRIQEYDSENKWTKKFLNGIIVKLTDITGNSVFASANSAVRNGQDGWVSFDNLTPGTYGILAYQKGYEGVWKQVDCVVRGSFENATITNRNTEAQVAAWDNHAPVEGGKTTVCQDLGVKQSTKGRLAIRISEVIKGEGDYQSVGYINEATVKLTDITGNTVFQTTTSRKLQNGEDGWVHFEDIPVGNYGVMAYKQGFVGAAKMIDCIYDKNRSFIQNQNTAGLEAGWNPNIIIQGGVTTVCFNIGLSEPISDIGHLHFRIPEFDGDNRWTGKFINGAKVKLTDTSGNTVVRESLSSVQNGEDGWVFLDNVPVGTYGILSYKSGHEGVWKQVDCNTPGGSFTNALIQNNNTEGLKAAWDNNAPILANQYTVCQDLGLKNLSLSQKGNLRFRIPEFDRDNRFTGKFLNNIVVKLTDTAGNNVVATQTSGVKNNEDGWVFFDGVTSGTYGIMAFQDGYEGVWKQVDCNTLGGSFSNATIQNSNTTGLKAAWDNHAPVNTNQTTVCQDLGLRKTLPLTGHLRFRVQEWTNNSWTGRFINDVTAKLTDQSGNTVTATATSSTKNNEVGWVFFDNVPIGTYGVMAYKTGFSGVWKQVDCNTPGGSLNNATINNSNTTGLTAAWDNLVDISANQVTVCQDLGLKLN